MRGVGKWYWLFAGAGTFLAPSAWADCATPFASPDEVLEFHLRTTRAAWAELEASELDGQGCDGQYPFFQMEFACGQDAPISIGVRRKRDRTETTGKLPLKLDFNRFVMGQRWPASLGELGYRRLSLNSGQPDDAAPVDGTGHGAVLSALVTEQLGWRLMREEVPEVSRVGYATLELEYTDTSERRYLGLFVLIEDFDRRSVRDRFAVDQGLLLKTTSLECRDQVEFDDGAPHAARDAYEQWLTLNPGDFAGQWWGRTDQAMHLDVLLRQEALRDLLANTADTPSGENRNNFYSLDLREDRRWFLPWDLDDLFRPQPQARPVTTPLQGTDPEARDGALGRMTRGHAEIRPRYLDTLCRLTNGVARPDKVLSELAAIDAAIRSRVALEPDNFDGIDPLDANTPGTYAAELERMRTWVPDRVEAVRQMIAEEGHPCDVGCTAGAVQDCEYFGRPSQVVCAGGVWGTCQAVGGPVNGGGDIVGAASSGGCGCRVPASSSGTSAPWVGLGLLLALAWRRAGMRAQVLAGG